MDNLMMQGEYVVCLFRPRDQTVYLDQFTRTLQSALAHVKEIMNEQVWHGIWFVQNLDRDLFLVKPWRTYMTRDAFNCFLFVGTDLDGYRLESCHYRWLDRQIEI